AVSSLDSVQAVAAGAAHSCALAAGGRVWCWGANDAGQLGAGGVAASDRPVAAAIDGIVEITAGATHTCARDGAGRVWCWGRWGDSATDRPLPISGLSGMQAITAGGGHACAL